MCWFSHDLEPYALKILSGRVLLAWLLFGSISLDVFTKFFIESGWIPVAQHRHLGVGVTHTLFFGIIVSLIIHFALKHRMGRGYPVNASLSFLIGQWSHVLLDSLDSLGLMILFPFSERFFSIGLWSYAAQLGHWSDLYVFYHSLAIVIESATFVFVWLKAWRPSYQRALINYTFKQLPAQREEKSSHYSVRPKAHHAYAGQPAVRALGGPSSLRLGMVLRLVIPVLTSLISKT